MLSSQEAIKLGCRPQRVSTCVICLVYLATFVSYVCRCHHGARRREHLWHRQSQQPRLVLRWPTRAGPGKTKANIPDRKFVRHEHHADVSRMPAPREMPAVRTSSCGCVCDMDGLHRWCGTVDGRTTDSCISQGAGYGIVLGFGIFFSLFTSLIVWMDYR